jgi:putative ABC transport system permease protein
MDQVETMKQIVCGSVGQSRFRTAVLVMFGLLSLFVASIGLYGVMSYSMSQRTREFGIRDGNWIESRRCTSSRLW